MHIRRKREVCLREGCEAAHTPRRKQSPDPGLPAGQHRAEGQEIAGPIAGIAIAHNRVSSPQVRAFFPRVPASDDGDQFCGRSQ